MDKKVNNRLLVEDMIDELIDYNIENLADLFGSRADTLTSLQYTALDRIFRYDGITPFDKMSNARIELEYNEMLENDFTD
tara:strand:- start:573 stop:812 length:240 start_codon:yes stop_codon:yes gene_type:complete